MYRFLTLVCSILVSSILYAQPADVIKNYINTYKDVAIEEMQRSGVPAAIKLAQGIHETSAGTSVLVIKSNNHFGIKCKSTWTGPSVSHTDDAPNECFRKYDDPVNSYKDHSDFLRGGDRYAFLFELDPLDYKGWAYGLKRAGYATNPRYPEIIIKLIEDYNLQDYTLIALNREPKNTPALTIKEQVKAVEEPIVEPAEVYPTDVFKINETKVIFAKKGTPFLAIAEQYSVPLARLFDMNDMQEQEEVKADQLIFLGRKRRVGVAEFHVVKKGETLYTIAQKEGIRLEALLDYNLLEGEMTPAIGESLFLKTKAPARPRLL